MATVTLTKGETTVTLPDPVPGATGGPARLQARGETANGTTYVYDAGVARYRAAYRFDNLAASDKTALAAFFHTVKGMAETFTFTDPAGTDHTARFDGAALNFSRHGADLWSVEIPLRLDAMTG